MKKVKMTIVTITVTTMTNAKQKVYASWFQESAYFIYDCSENNN